jgi:hypothetical protein
LLGITQPAVSKYLKDRIPPPLVLLKLARASRTTIEWILTGIRKDERTGMVAEPGGDYPIVSNLDERIARLPSEIQIHFLRLLESIETELCKKG